MWKKHELVMLPTNEKANIFLTQGKLYYSSFDDSIPKNNAKNQHLYILSSEEIKEGDWYIADNKVYGASVDHMPELYTYPCKKIIATTDTSLNIENAVKKANESDCEIGSTGWIKIKESNLLLQPPKSFIEYFISEYNKGNIITKVMVEYEECKPGMCKINNMTCGHSGCSKPFLKINPKDNTITIRKMKDSWTKKEQFENIIKFRDDYEKFKNDCHFGPNNKEIDEWTDNWIEQNL